jgi:hypothetical protein
MPATPDHPLPGQRPSTTAEVEIDGAVSRARVRLEQRRRKARSLDQLVPAVVLAFKVFYRLNPESWSATSRSAHRRAGAVKIDESRVTRPFRQAVWTVDRVGPGRRFGGTRAV